MAQAGAGTTLADAVIRVPLPHDPDRGRAALDLLPPDLRSGPMRDLLLGAAGTSPYLARLLHRHGDWLAQAAAQPPEAAMQALLDTLCQDVAQAQALAPIRSALRRTKARAALLIALADLSGAWRLAEVTAALTRLADTACQQAAGWLLAQEIAAGKLPGLDDGALAHGAGYVVLAMGKMGAHELNYSSDIDLIALFDDALFDPADMLDARARYIHVTRQLVKLLSENTGEGYVFRTDLRLRPAPSTTPVCMSLDAAERYYESVGRTWERAAHIKARPLIDVRAGQTYLQTLAPFIWRRHLDYAAIDDIRGMLRKIRAQKATFSATAIPGHDLKRGPGGIREIEFFVQTRQLIMGGRNPVLRLARTVDALQALAGEDIISAQARDALAEDYEALRTIEHRLQMMEDTQTHAVPKAPEARARLAALCGTDDLAAFERGLADRLARVHATAEEFFVSGSPDGASAPAMRIDEQTLAQAGFERPGDAARQIARWHAGEIAATRSDRARELFMRLEPQIVDRLSGAASPDQALIHFDRFLTGLPAGVQVFSLFTANPKLLDLIVAICAAAPRLAGYLGRHSQMLDALVERDFWQPLRGVPDLVADLEMRLVEDHDYERVLDTSRRWAREMWFRAGVHVLRGVADQREAGAAFTGIAEASIAGLLPHVIADFSTRHGPPPGHGMAVLAMGKLGSGEMTAGSDLDIITIYDPGDAETSSGRRPLAPQTYYPRLTQALVAALTAQTAEGALYEVDMRLRPSGRQGPVAVSLSAFQSYQQENAWVWEHLALTRARVIAGPDALGAAVGQTIRQALAGRAGQGQVLEQAGAMRARLIQANAAQRTAPWALKLAAGGLMEIEFLAQTGALYCGLAGHRAPRDVLPRLAQAGWIDTPAATVLADAHRLQSRLQQIERVALDDAPELEAIGMELRRILAQAGPAADFDHLCTDLAALRSAAAAVCDARLPAVG